MYSVLASLLTVAPIEAVIPEPTAIGDLEAGQAALLAEEIAGALPAEAFKVTTAGQMVAVLGMERQRQLLGCSEESSSCAAELASALGAEVVVQSTLARIDNGLRAAVTFTSGRDGTALERINIEAATVTEILDRLPDEIGTASSRVFARLRAGHQLEPSRPGVRRFAWAPAALGGVLIVSGAALFGATASTWSRLNSRTNSVDNPDSLADSGRSTQTAGWVLCVTGAAALGVSAAMLALGAPTPSRVVVAPVAGSGGGGFVISGELP